MKIYYLFDFLIEALFLTNVWLIVYIKSIDYLNFKFPAPVVSTLGNPMANPEAFEVPLYILLSILFVIVIWLRHNYFPKLFQTVSIFKFQTLHHPIIKFSLFFLLLFLWLKKLGVYPLAGDPYPYTVSANKLPIKLELIIYLGLIVFLILQTAILQKILKKKSLFIILVYGLIIFISALITFEPRFRLSPLDAAFFYAPAWEMVNAKALFTDVPSVYGFLSILIFASIYKYLHINFAYLPVLIWFFFVIEYFLCFYLIFKISRSLPFALLGFFSIITSNYLSLFHLPQGGPLRWLPLFLAIYLLYKFREIDSKGLIVSIFILSLWNIDSGIALILAYILTIFLLFLARKVSVRRIFNLGIFVILAEGLIIGLIELATFFLTRKFFNFLGLFDRIKRNAISGVLMLPMETHTYFWLFILLYFSCIMYFFRNLRTGRDLSLQLFSANVAFFASIYYVGRSVVHNLITVNPFILLAFFLLTGALYKNIASRKIRLLILGCFFAFLIFFTGYSRKEFLTSELMDRYQRFRQGRIFSFENDEILKQRYQKEIELIKEKIQEDEIIIISADDTYLFYLLDKKNLLDANPIAGINTPDELTHALKRAAKACPKNIVVECEVLKKCTSYSTFTKTWPELPPLILAELEKKCQVKYEPVDCTNQLCIASSKP